MDDIELLQMLLQEEKYPYFDEDKLEAYLDLHSGDCYSAASELCLMKADGDKKIKVGPIEIEGPGADYWLTLSKKYAEKSLGTQNKPSGYKTNMKRVDRQ